MGVISKKLASRLRRAKKLLGDLRRQVAIDFSKIPRNVQGKVTLDTPGYDPLHAAYIAAQNFTGLFMEEVTQFPEFDSYWKIYGPAQKEYMPSGPPISPLTKSFFTAWAFFDLHSGPDRETIGSCLLDVAELLEMDPFMVETIRQFQDSRMGIYEHCGSEGGRIRLRELVTDDEFTCHVGNLQESMGVRQTDFRPALAPAPVKKDIGRRPLRSAAVFRGIGDLDLADPANDGSGVFA